MHVGPIVSSDLFYNPDEGQYERWSKRGVLAVEMEAAALFTVGALRGVQSGCLLVVSDIVVEGEFKRISDDEMRAAVDRMTRVALATVRRISDTVFLVNPASDNGATGRRWPEIAHRAAQRGLEGDTLFSERPGRAGLAGARGGRRRGEAARRRRRRRVGERGRERDRRPHRRRGRRDPSRHRLGFRPHLRDSAQARRRDRRGTHRPAADDRPGTGPVPGLGRERRRVLVRERRQRGHERRDRPARERDDEGARRQGLLSLGDARRVRALAELGAARVGRRPEPRRPMHDVVVANGRTFGGGMIICPDAEPDDGLFDVLTIGDLTKRDLLVTLPKTYRARHLPHPKAELLRGAVVTVDADAPLPIELDGEQPGTTPVRFEVSPGAAARCASPTARPEASSRLPACARPSSACGPRPACGPSSLLRQLPLQLRDALLERVQAAELLLDVVEPRPRLVRHRRRASSRPAPL